MITTLFKIANLKNVLLLDHSSNMVSLTTFIENLGLKMRNVITSNQKFSLLQEFPCKVFDKLDQSFKDLINKEFLPENTLFISLGARWIFSD